MDSLIKFGLLGTASYFLIKGIWVEEARVESCIIACVVSNIWLTKPTVIPYPPTDIFGYLHYQF